jgi:hypothetical protein
MKVRRMAGSVGDRPCRTRPLRMRN